MEIISYEKKYQPFFERLNLDWLEKYFRVEPIDVKVLGDPDTYIIQPGGGVYFVMYEGEIIGTAALKIAGAEEIELTKMAVDLRFQGIGAGKFLCSKMIEKAKDMKFKRLILYSNTKLKTALGIYKKLGFEEIPLEIGIYERADIKMQIIF